MSNEKEAKLKALQLTLDKLDKAYGKGTVMRMNDEALEEVEAISSAPERIKLSRNNSKRITFDQLLLSRKFHTYLYRIDNVMNDRDLLNTPYINEDPYLRITESQRLKEIIRNFEHDMWSN